MTDRRKAQNYQALCHYLTDGLWDTLQQESKEKSVMSLYQHLWCLGLRCPSEATFAMVHGILNLARPGRRDETSFGKYKALGLLKQQWKRYRHPDQSYFEYVEILPENPRDGQLSTTWLPFRLQNRWHVVAGWQGCTGVHLHLDILHQEYINQQFCLYSCIHCGRHVYNNYGFTKVLAVSFLLRTLDIGHCSMHKNN